MPLSTRAVQILEVLTRGKTPDQQLIPMTSQSLGCRYREVRAKAGLKGANLRFYEPAPGRNYVAGVQAKYSF